MMSSLHLDAEEEPRRGLAVTSRANSVRFDESANQNHTSHASRPSVDFLPRTSSGLGGLHMTERATSHRSEGRASSAHSVRSAASGRASSLNLDMPYGFGDSSRSPLDTPALAPGLGFLGSAPAIIRCWMNTNFKHDALLYAAVCTGSYASYLDLRLIRRLGFEQEIRVTESAGVRAVQLSVYFPEAVPHPASSRSSSPAAQLPSLTVDFQVVERVETSPETKAIQIFIGSDVLRQHHADILFSSNSMTMFDDERSKLSIPLVRPETEAAFKSLYITSAEPQGEPRGVKSEAKLGEQSYINGLGMAGSIASVSSTATSPPSGRYRPPGALMAETSTSDAAKPGTVGSHSDIRPGSRQSIASRPSLSLLSIRSEAQDEDHAPESQTPASRSGNTPTTWGSWRRDGPTAAPTTAPPSAGLDWVNASKPRDSYQRKEAGIKVLKPKLSSRTISSTATSSTAAASPSEGRSRFFDDGRRRSGGADSSWLPKVNAVKDISLPAAMGSSGSTVLTPKTKANPIGGASAFSWLNSGGDMGAK